MKQKLMLFENKAEKPVPRILVSVLVVLSLLFIVSCSTNGSRKNYEVTQITKTIPFSEDELLEYLRNSQSLDPIEGIWSESSMTQIKYDDKQDWSKSYNKRSSTNDRCLIIIVKEDLKNSSSFAMLHYKDGTVKSEEKFGVYSTTIIKDLIDPTKYYGSLSSLINGKPKEFTIDYILNENKIYNTMKTEYGDSNYNILIITDFLYQRVENQ